MKTSVSTLACALPVLLLVAAAPAFGQQGVRPERPYRGLFASGGATSEQQLILSASVGGGYDDNLLADAVQRTVRSAPNARSQSGVLGNAGLGLSYSLNRTRFQLQASGHTGVRHYPSLAAGDELVAAEEGTVAASLRVADGTNVTVTALVARRPKNLDDVFATDLRTGPDADDLDLPTTFDYYRRYGGAAALTQRISSRASFNANYSHRRGDAALRPSLATQRAGGALTYRLGRGLGLRAGYTYGEAWHPGTTGRRTNFHTIDAGLDYSRALSFSRQTTLSFGTGTSAVEHNGTTRYRATGRATLAHEIGRTWLASLSYFRGARIVETWDEPLFSDVATASLSGFVNRRVQVTGGAGGSLRELGVSSGRSGYSSYWGTANLSLALSRHLNFGVAYLYTRHRFDVDLPRPWAWPQNGARQRVTAHLSMWMPLLRETRRPDAAR